MLMRFDIKSASCLKRKKATYEYIQYLCNPLLVYLSIQDADLYGSRQYTEAEQARYTNPPLLLPKYDTQEELLEVWLKELDQTINYLSSNEIKDVLNNQDFIYKGDLKKMGQTGQFFEIENCSPFDKQRPEPCF